MLTLEKVGWIAVILGLIIAVTAAIVVPIYDKAKDQGESIEGIEFDVSYRYEMYLTERNVLMEGVLYDANTRAA